MEHTPSIISTPPRDYQKAIFQTAKDNNTLVVLPTGVGKTLIALMLSVQRKKLHPKGKILFLAPTRPLAEQHLHYFEKNLPELFAEMNLFTGAINAEKRQKIWQTAEIIFSTPQCIANDLENYLYNLDDVSLLIIDEAHRCLKNYDYTKVVNHYKNHAKNQRILGLTASPGHDSDKVRQIGAHLDISEIEVRTRDSEDVKPYIKEREFTKIEVPFPPEFMEIRALLKKFFDSKVSLLKEKGFLMGPANKITLLNLQTRLSSQISSGNFAAMYGMSLCAQAIKISHALELLETQTLSGLSDYFATMIQQAKEKKSRAVQAIVKSPEFTMASLLLSKLKEKNIDHPKLSTLSVLIAKEINENPNAKIIVFAQFRETISKIKALLNKNPKIRAEIFIGQAKKTTSKGTFGLSQKEQKQIIDNFKLGKINVLCATSIGEEGLDIPEVNAVIFYEPIPSAIRKIQRAGRTARLQPGKLIILVTKDTRDEIHHYASSARERKMHKIIKTIKEEIKHKGTLDKFIKK